MSFRKPRWGLMDVVLVYVGILGVGIIFGMFGDALLDYMAGFVNIPNNEFGYFILSFVVQFIVTVVLVLIFARGKWRELGIRNASGRNYIKYGLMGGIILLIIISLAGYIIQYYAPDLQPQVYEEMLRSAQNLPGFILVLLIGTVLAPISEELFYRGMMYPVFRGYLGPLGGAITAGIVFGLSHWDLWRTIPLAIGGAILCYIYEKTGSIFVSALAHGLWNGIMSLIIYFSIAKLV